MCDTAEMLCTSSRDCGMLHFIGGVFTSRWNYFL